MSSFLVLGSHQEEDGKCTETRSARVTALQPDCRESHHAHNTKGYALPKIGILMVMGFCVCVCVCVCEFSLLEFKFSNSWKWTNALCKLQKTDKKCIPGSTVKYKGHFCTCKNYCAASKDKSEFNKSKTVTPQHDSNSEETITAVVSKQYVIYLYLWV